jgi:acyl carrier protein
VTDPKWRKLVVDALHSFSNVLNEPAIHRRLRAEEDIPVADLGLDSLDAVEWCMEIEERTGLEIDPAQLTEYKTINALAAHIAARAAR